MHAGAYASHCFGVLIALNGIEEIKKALNDYGYSQKAIREIMKWYELLGKESHVCMKRAAD